MSFFDADYSAIEARIVNWLAGQEDALTEYRAGVDRYKRMASVIYRKPEDKISKHPERFIGKQCILLSGFQGGAAKFRQTCEKFGYKDMPSGLEDTAVEAFRQRHKDVVHLWYATEEAAKLAILHPDRIFRVKGKGGKEIPDTRYVMKDIEGTKFLLCKLPSGRKLAYPRPRMGPSRKFPDRQVIYFFGNVKGATWGNVDTYGGKLVENNTQAVAADVMTCGTTNAERAGYETATLIHDENLSYVKPGQTVEEFVRLLTTMPDWASGLPIEAEGELVSFYKK